MIWLLRHADAVEGQPDASRPLTPRGVRHATDAGFALARLGVRIDACLSSPKVRAMQTARLACAPLEVEVEECAALSGQPFDTAELTVGRGEVLLVGHDPSFSLTLHDMTGTQVRMRKCGLAGVEKGELMVLLRPSELSAIAAAAGRPVGEPREHVR
ncbi:MAG: SixA phosphatase family protein [Solirubrobacteraceae bacterium]